MKITSLLIAACMASACNLMSAPQTQDAGTPEREAGEVLPDASQGRDAGVGDVGRDAAIADALPVGTCRTASDCPADERCSYLGLCHPHECLGHLDCPENQRCADRQCLNRVAAEHGVLFERYRPEALQAHRSLIPSVNGSRQFGPGSWGFGGALFDLDGDHDLDLFVGVQSAHLEGGSPPCIFRNVSVGSTPEYEAIAEYCAAPPRDLSGGFGFDVEGDGYHELVVTGANIIELWRFEPSFSITDLRALLAPEDARRSCNAGAAVNVDLNFDGRLDLVVACYFDGMPENGAAVKHLAFVQTAQGWEALAGEQWTGENAVLLEARNSTNALGAADLNDDGLIDLMVSEDFYIATIPGPISNRDPGGIYFRCDPRNDCNFRISRIGAGDRERGGYMGSGVLQVEGRGELTYFTDIGPNRLVQVNGERVRDFAAASRVQLDFAEDVPLFSWGVVVDDFDRDGRDDLVVSQGALQNAPMNEYAAHFLAFMRQEETGRFVTHGDDLGLQPYTAADTEVADVPFSGRALLRADLDNDGYIDLVEMGIETRPRFHREVPLLAATPRCTLIPRTRYVPGFGVGHALLPPNGGAARKWDNQGQIKSGTTPFILSPYSRAQLRFPSGAEVAFDCLGGSGPVLVEEPAWIDLSRQGQQLTIALGDAAPEGELNVLVQPSGDLLAAAEDGSGAYRVDLTDGTERVMLRIGERWIARWWEP